MRELAHATIDDIPQLCELLALLFAQEAEFAPDRNKQAAGLREIITHPEIGRILILREDAVVIAMVNLLFTVSTALGGRVALLEDMIVHPAYRGSGTGSRLLQAAMEFARSSGCLRITLLTDRDNVAAQGFYRHHAFKLSTMLPMRLSLCEPPDDE